jgi:hypothetical protein
MSNRTGRASRRQSGSAVCREEPVPLTDTMKSIFENAADMARRRLDSARKFVPMAFFAYENNAMKTVSFSFTNELQKDAWIRRIREKALAERASCVLVMIAGDDRKEGVAILSGAAPGAQASARLDYRFDEKTKTIALWKITFLNHPARNDFICSIFG